MKKGKIKVDLSEVEHLGLIVIKKTGVIYTNQTGGYACLHPKEEGFYLPLANDKNDIIYRLSQFFTVIKWKGGCWDGIDEETADFIDKLLRKYLSFISVDRTFLKQSHESWIYVILSQPVENDCVISGFDNLRGVLTWPNSD